LLLTLLLALVPGCGGAVVYKMGQTQVGGGAADAFIDAFEAELSRRGHEWTVIGSDAWGLAGNIHTMNSTYTVSGMDADELHEICVASEQAWGQLERYGTRGTGGGGSRHGLHFGTQRTHAFVDLLAHGEGDVIRIRALIRIVAVE
jgi:hypothetical protein